MAIAGRGGGGSKPSGSASTNSQLTLAECMRAHGAPSFPDPTQGPGGEGFSISSSPRSSTVNVDGIPFSGPAFESAAKTCKLFGGGSAPPPVSESQKLAPLTFAQCMRSHGVPNYPRPDLPRGRRDLLELFARCQQELPRGQARSGGVREAVSRTRHNRGQWPCLDSNQGVTDYETPNSRSTPASTGF